MGSVKDTLASVPDLQSVSMNCCDTFPANKTVILVESQRVEEASELFYDPVSISGQSSLRGMLDLGSISCTLGEEAESKLRAAGVVLTPQPVPESVMLIGCGGLLTHP